MGPQDQRYRDKIEFERRKQMMKTPQYEKHGRKQMGLDKKNLSTPTANVHYLQNNQQNSEINKRDYMHVAENGGVGSKRGHEHLINESIQSKLSHDDDEPSNPFEGQEY
jgi:hypothetical protein